MEPDIHIIPLNEIEKKILNYLKENLEKIFNTETGISDKVNIGISFCNPKRNQYHAYEILKFLIRKIDFIHRGDIFIGIFKKDLYTPSLNFVFGLATKYPKACLISLARLHPSFYGKDESDHKDERIYFERILTEAVHEIGHTLGLDHCENPKCVMYFSNTLEDTDIKGCKFCEKCRKSIQG
jgi:archaemetzincin